MATFLDGNLITWETTMIAGVPLTGSAYRSPDGEVVWIDPPALGNQEAHLLQLGRPQHILVTFRDHDRAVGQLAERYSAKVWIPRGQGGSIPKVDVEFDENTSLPAGLRAVGLQAAGYGEHALFAEAYGKRFAFIGDAVFNLQGGTTYFFVPLLAFKNRGGPLSLKKSYRGGDTSAVPGQLQKLLDLDLDALFLSHGPAVPTEADRWLRVCLGAAAK